MNKLLLSTIFLFISTVLIAQFLSPKAAYIWRGDGLSSQTIIVYRAGASINKIQL